MEELAAGDAAPQAYDLADALVAGDLRAALALAEELEAHGERPGRLSTRSSAACARCTARPRCSRRACPTKKVAEALKAPPWLAKKTVARAKKADRAALERAICVFAELEVELRGGGDPSTRTPRSR